MIELVILGDPRSSYTRTAAERESFTATLPPMGEKQAAE